MAKDEKVSAEAVVRVIRRQTRRVYSAEAKIRIVLEGLLGQESIAELCRREAVNPNEEPGAEIKCTGAGERRMGRLTHSPAAEKLGLIRLVEDSPLPVKQTLSELYTRGCNPNIGEEAPFPCS